MATSAQSFALVKGQVLEKGIGLLKIGDKKRLANTISVLIEDNDRVFDIKRGTVVKYPVSERDANDLKVGSTVVMFVSSYGSYVQILSMKGQ